MKTVVVDSSFAAAWCFEDEVTPRTEAILVNENQFSLVVPLLWRWEIANVFITAERRGRITADQTAMFVERLSWLRIKTDNPWNAVTTEHLIALARAHSLTAYDAAYLELADRLHASLATLDDHLAVVAKRLGIEVL